ncbi:signal peptidase II [bacterium]|nr:MAG: signal peptidase II [bacterium]
MIPAIIISVLFLDQLTKFLASSFLRLNTPVILINNFLNLSLVHNRGAAFGILKNQLFMFVIISLVTIALILCHLKDKKRSFLSGISLSLILGGAAGNLIDRLRFGFVIDFLDFRVWPVFNIADSAITIGVILLSWELLCRKN